MKNIIMNKLRSQTGASITFALLIFLVCTVLCSVILTAATASSGRMSGITEADQRYYAVTSAAELLQELIDGKTVSVVVATETMYTTTYSNGVPGDPVEGSSVTKTYIVADKKASEISEADYKNVNGTDKTDCLLKTGSVNNESFKNDTIPKDAAKNVNAGTALDGSDSGKDRFTLAPTFSNPSGFNADTLKITISEDLDTTGNITLTICNAYNTKGGPSESGDRYTLILPFGVDKNISTSTKTENISSTTVGDNTYNVVTKETKTTITTLTWRLNGIKTSS